MTFLSHVYCLNPVVAIEDFGERSLALHCEDLRMIELNATARDLLRRLDGETSLEQVAAAIAEEYGQPLEIVLADVQETVVQMVDLDLVVSGNHAEHPDHTGKEGHG
jgi:hypothetical protein